MPGVERLGGMAQQRLKNRLVRVFASDAAGFQWPVRGRLHYLGGRIAALFMVLLCLIPPDGMLSDNEEEYFQLAARSVSAIPNSPESAVFDSSPHRIVADRLFGWLV